MTAEPLTFTSPEDAAVVTAGFLVVTYTRADGSNSYMVHARGDMPATWFLGMTVWGQDEIKKWGHDT